MNGVTPNVGSHSFSMFSDAARPNGSSHRPDFVPLSPPSQLHIQHRLHVRVSSQPASAMTSHCSSSWAPLDDTGNSLRTHDKPSLLKETTRHVNVHTYVIVCCWVGFAPAG